MAMTGAPRLATSSNVHGARYREVGKVLEDGTQGADPVKDGVIATQHKGEVVRKIHLKVVGDKALHLPAQTIVIEFVHQDEVCLRRRSLRHRREALRAPTTVTR